MIFGFTPVSELGIPDDANLTQANCIPLGIIPKRLDVCVEQIEINAKKQIQNRVLGNALAKEYRERWEIIKEINVARAVWLHRITGVISKAYEKDFKLKYGLDDGSYRKLKHNLKVEVRENIKDTSILRKRKFTSENASTQSPTSSKLRKKVKFAEIGTPNKTCIGISCAQECHKWSMRKFKPNIIAGTHKHCKRCSKQ